jgi:hypothetical protein
MGNRSVGFPPCAPLTTTNRAAGFVLHRISLNDGRSRAVTSAIEPPRATSLGAQPARDNAGFVTSRGASSPRTPSASRLMRSRKPLFFGPKSHFNLQRDQPDTDASRDVIQSDLVQPWVPDWPTSSSRESRLPARPNFETAAQIAVERIPETCVATSGGALRHPRNKCVAPAGIQLRASLRESRCR